MTETTTTLRGLPFVGCLFSFRRDPLRFLRETAARSGRAWIPLGRNRVLLVTAPEDVDHVLRHAHESYGKREQLLLRVMGESVLTTEGKVWMERRRIVQKELGPDSMPHLAGTSATEVRKLIDDWRRLAGAPTDLERDMRRLTLNIIVRVMFSASMSDADLEEARGAIDVAMEYVQARWLGLVDVPLQAPTPLNSRFKKAIATLDRIVYQMIRGRRAGGDRDGSPDHPDLLDQLLKATHKRIDPRESAKRFDPRESAKRFEDQEIRNEVMTIFLAGHETTAMALSWAFDLLGRHAGVARQVHEEAVAVLGGRVATLDDLSRLPAASRVVHETLRLYPPAWLIHRVAKVEDHLAGEVVPAGTTVWLSPYLTHRRREVWGADADEYKPERWKGHPKLPDGAFIPFGIGPRECAGDLFALTELTLIVASVCQHFRVDPLNATPVLPRPLITLRPRRGSTCGPCLGPELSALARCRNRPARGH